MSDGNMGARIDAVRRFNRFWTRRIGVLREGLLHTPYTLTEARVLLEISHRANPTATDLSRELGLDPGYLSRLLGRLEERGLVERVSSEADGRRRVLSLTSAGGEAFSLLDSRSREEVGEMLVGLSEGEQRCLLEAMRTVEAVLDGGAARGFKYSEPFYLRPPEHGDMGWVVQRHGVLYNREYGWNERFEALVARIVADFVEGYDASRERCWIAEMSGKNVGCVFVVKESEIVAKLRLLLVEPEARSLGLGTRLVDECIRFARGCGYKKLVLWTNSVLGAARHVYEEKGFELVEEGEHHSFGKDLVGQNWELVL